MSDRLRLSLGAQVRGIDLAPGKIVILDASVLGIPLDATAEWRAKYRAIVIVNRSRIEILEVRDEEIICRTIVGIVKIPLETMETAGIYEPGEIVNISERRRTIGPLLSSTGSVRR